MNNRRAFRLWQAKWLIRGVLRGHSTPHQAIRIYRNTRFIPTLTPELRRLREEFDTTDQSEAVENGTIEGDEK